MKKANVTTAIDDQNMLSVLTPCSDAAIGKKSGLAFRNDHEPKITNKSQKMSIAIPFALLKLSTVESSSSLPLNLLFNLILLAITETAKKKNTMAKRPIR